MKNFKEILADAIRGGENVAIYCHGLHTDILLWQLDHDCGVHPAVVIDNDPRKRGTADFGIPVLPFAEAREKFPGLKYFICSGDFKYSIIGDLLEHGVSPEDIFNYVPVERRKSCIYIYSRLHAELMPAARDGHSIQVCALDSFGSHGLIHIPVPSDGGTYRRTEEMIHRLFDDFEAGRIEECRDCPLLREQYVVRRDHRRPHVVFCSCQPDCTDCLSHCVYCCAVREGPVTPTSDLEGYGVFLDRILAADTLEDDFYCSINMSERDMDKKICAVMDALDRAGKTPLFWKVNTCLLQYSEHLAELMRRGGTYVIWSLDAGTRETYRRVKGIDAFDQTVSAMRRQIADDPAQGRGIVPKYIIIKGINDNEAEFDAFLDVIQSLGVRFMSLSYDYDTEADEADQCFIRQCYEKLTARGLRLVYMNDSKQVTGALNMVNLTKR